LAEVTPGDANCDGGVTAADLPAVLMQIVDGVPAACTNADATDLSATIDAVFGP